MKIGIIGNGTVGHATARAWMEYAEVRVNDIEPGKSPNSLAETLDSDFVFLCFGEDRLEGFIRMLAEGVKMDPETIFVIKSTCPIGTTAKLAKEFPNPLLHSPEFLTERCAVADALLPSRNIIGVPKHVPKHVGAGPMTAVLKPTGVGALTHLYLNRWPGIAVLAMPSDESEAVKLFCNAFFAVKVGLFNEFRSLADRLYLDWDNVLAGILSDGRILPNHTQVPGPDGKRGFGGKCLMKDLTTLIGSCVRAGAIPYIMTAAQVRNKYHDRKSDDAEGQCLPEPLTTSSQD